MIKKIKSFFKNSDKVLLLLTIFMLGFGLINIVTASSREAVLVNQKSVYYYFYRQMFILFVGFLGSIFAINFPTKKYNVLGKIIYGLVLLLVIYCFFMNSRRGAQNWIIIPGIGFQLQPSELAKIALIIVLSMMFEKYYNNYRNPNAKNHMTIIGITIIIAIIFPFFVFLQKDLGTAIIMGVIVLVFFLGSPIIKKEKFFIIKSVAIFGCLVLAVLYMAKGSILTEAQLSRFDFFNPCSKYETGGYQTCNAYIALNDGGLFGLGISKSKQKYSYIPEPHTDSIFAIIGEEWGAIRSTICVFLPYIFILYRIFDIASKASTIRGRYICLGVGTYIFIHIFINLGGLLALIPLTGVPLPFLSYGGTYTMCLMFAMALVQRVYIETKTKKIKIED